MIVPTYETTAKEQELIISRLEKENQELKKQLKNIEKTFRKKHEEDSNIINCCLKKEFKNSNQQKDFISWLENEIYSIEPTGTDINYNCEYNSEEDFISAMKEQSRLHTLKEILSKYKEIIGVSNE